MKPTVTDSAAAISAYVAEVSRIHAGGMATEHSYRAAIMGLIRSLMPGLVATNEPKRIECGSPDIILTEKDVPVGYIETKIPFDDDLEGRAANKEQFARYLASLDKVIFTDFLRFRFYERGEFKTEIVLGGMSNDVKRKWKPGESFMSDEIVPDKSAFELFATTFAAWCAKPVQSIRTANELSKMMAGKARQIAYVIEHALSKDIADGADLSQSDATLRAQYEVFRKLLIHDLSPELFADTYAQTVVYGMFAARLHDTTLDTFDRHEAAELIPKSNPFLRSLFGYISGPDLDDRVKPFIDDLAAVFRASDVRKILVGRKSEKAFARDPMIHFYEDFLRDYDAMLRKNRGVWYTPQSVVQFIVRGVDSILRSDFGLKDGLADASKVQCEMRDPGTDKKRKVPVHRVQVLDPACGTGTFLAEIVRLVREKPRFAKMPGLWPDYATKDLVPRLNGFELLMASYVIAHIKLELLLEETGAVSGPGRDRLHVYLTNSLEPPNPYVGTLLAYWLAKEAEAADHIKRESPVFVVVGNPPYSISSQNKGKWIQGLVDDYKQDLTERKINIEDDYIKFIRLGQYLIDKTGEGVLAYISNNSFLDGITHRTMRKKLLTSFDEIRVLNLHGNARKKEKCQDGGQDKNVFEIMQGVCITFFVKHKASNRSQKGLARLTYADLLGKREEKFKILAEADMESFEWQTLKPAEPFYFFVPKDFSLEDEYKKGFSLAELFPLFNAGLKTDRDALFMDYDEKDLQSRMCRLLSGEYDSSFANQFDVKNSGSYKLLERLKDKIFDPSFTRRITYRPFDTRWIYYDPKLISRPAYAVFRHFNSGCNTALLLAKQTRDMVGAFVVDTLANHKSFSAYDITSVFPLYLYPDEDDLLAGAERKPNLDPAIFAKICECVSGKTGLQDFQDLQDLNEGFKENPDNPRNPVNPVEKDLRVSVSLCETITPEDVLHYIYAVLYSPSYRERYKEFLKTDFPRVPYPKSAEEFRRLAALGARLTAIHLMESDELDDPPATYPVTGDNRVDSPKFDVGRVYINAAQYFGEVTERSWNFFIGGYQPAQKWLKDRRGRVLSPFDIIHYARMLRALDLTAEIMSEIDGIFRV